MLIQTQAFCCFSGLHIPALTHTYTCSTCLRIGVALTLTLTHPNHTNLDSDPDFVWKPDLAPEPERLNLALTLTWILSPSLCPSLCLTKS